MSPPWIAAFVVLWTLVLFEAVVLVGLLRRVSGALEQVEGQIATAAGIPETAGISPGSVIPAFSVLDTNGTAVDSNELIVAPSIALLVAPDCASCRYLARELDGVGTTVDGLPLFVFMQSAPDQDDLRFRAGTLLYDSTLEAARAFRSAATPVAFTVDRGGFVLDRTIPNSLDDLRVLALRQEGGAIPTHA